LKGIELETRLQFSDSLSLAANFAYHDARFTRSLLGLEGKQLTMSPHLLASAGLLYSQESGVQASIVFAYVGSRFLDEENLVATSPYVTLDATFGYRFRQFSVAIEGTNLTNARPPTSQSEFGSASYYLMPARTAFLRLTANLD
jgi:iron complex outermembrane recepter protein